MKSSGGWINSKDYQVLKCKDNSDITEQLKEQNIVNLSFNEKDNLGLHRYEGKIFTGNHIGICRLKDTNGNNIRGNENKKEILLQVESRFNISIIEMLNFVKNDDEFERYLAPQTVKRNAKEKEIEEFSQNELFYFFENEAPMRLESSLAKESSILTITFFLTMLKQLCSKPLMGKMLANEQNLVGKVKGKILFDKQIKHNISKGREDRVYCKYLEFSEDILENQILKAALYKSKKFIKIYFKDIEGGKSNYNKLIAYCTNSLKHISNKKIKIKECNGLKFTGCYASYEKVIKLAKSVLEEVSVNCSGGEIATSNYILPYAISMEKLFEIYVRASLKKGGIGSYRENKETIMRKYDEKRNIFSRKIQNGANYIDGPIKPDIVINNLKKNKYIVFDVKYKNYKNTRYARNDRLQLLAYGLIYNCEHMGLIFPKLKNEESEILKDQLIQSENKKEIRYHQFLVDLEKEGEDKHKKLADYLKILLE